MSAPAVLAVVLAAVVAVQLRRAYRADDRFLERWARERGLALTPETAPIVERYVLRVRVWRTWGGIAGALLPTLVALVANGRVVVLGFGTDGRSAPLAFGGIFAGWLVGALAAEISLARPAPGARRAARITPRELAAYVPRRVVLAQRTAAAAGAAGAIAVGLVPYAEPVRPPSTIGAVAGAALLLALGAGLEAVERWVVRRAQPYASAAAVAADDVVRAESAQTVAGAGLALLLLLCAGVALVLQAADVAALHAAMVVPAVVCLVLSLVVCRDVVDRPWRVARVPAEGPART